MDNKDFSGKVVTAFLGCSPEIEPDDYPVGSYVLIKCDDAVRVGAGEVIVTYNQPPNKGCGNCGTPDCSPMLEQGCKMFEMFSHWTPERGDQ